MFWKKQQPDQPTQSQSISGAQISNAQVQMNQAGRDGIATQSGNLAQQQQGITGKEVVTLLEQLEASIKTVGLPSDQQEKVLAYLSAAKTEVATEDEDADKNFVANKLKKVGETLDAVDKATDTGKNLWQKGQEVFTAIAPWLGAAAKLLAL